MNETGRRQAEQLRKRMESFEVELLYSSPLERAFETARPIAEEKGLKIIVRDELKEIDFGHWEGLTLEEIREQYAEEYVRCSASPMLHGFYSGMPFENVRKTISSFVDECILSNTVESIAIVSHAIVIRMLLTVLLDFPGECFNAFYTDNCSISIVQLSERRNILLKLNDNSHIHSGVKTYF